MVANSFANSSSRPSKYRYPSRVATGFYQLPEPIPLVSCGSLAKHFVLPDLWSTFCASFALGGRIVGLSLITSVLGLGNKQVGPKAEYSGPYKPQAGAILPLGKLKIKTSETPVTPAACSPKALEVTQRCPTEIMFDGLALSATPSAAVRFRRRNNPVGWLRLSL